jgi:uncharacterized membrane protein
MRAHLMAGLRRNISMPGLAAGVLLFSLAMTPSLLPRSAQIQGVLSGCSFAIGYAIGAIVQWIWTYLEIRLPGGDRFWKWVQIAIGAASIVIAFICLWYTTEWQNSVRGVVGAPPVDRSQPILIFLIALVPAIVVVVLGTLLTHAVRFAAHWLQHLMPPRAAGLLGLLTVGLVTAALFSGVLLRGALHTADSFFQKLDGLAGDYGPAPTDPLRSGSATSLVAWNTIGHDGRIYVQSGPTKEQIETVIGRPAKVPLRVYVGLRSAPTTEDRAHLALAEMRRIGAFDRSVLLIISPVGTGWVDPPGIDSAEYLMAGDISSVSLQYSYLTSPLALVVEPDYGVSASQTLFNVIYAYWTKLPHDHRPKLYLNGLSLGAHSSQYSTQFLDTFGDPIQGALWVGPPYTSPIWKLATRHRQPGSPEWLPRYGDDSSIRFSSHLVPLTAAGPNWGPMRIGFLEHSSDPVVFFDWHSLYRPPAWMVGERGPDISPDFHWYPIVTVLQLGMDMALAQTAPVGYGHNYSPDDYVTAWTALLDPPGWTDAQLTQLKATMDKAITPS